MSWDPIDPAQMGGLRYLREHGQWVDFRSVAWKSLIAEGLVIEIALNDRPGMYRYELTREGLRFLAACDGVET